MIKLIGQGCYLGRIYFGKTVTTPLLDSIQFRTQRSQGPKQPAQQKEVQNNKYQQCYGKAQQKLLAKRRQLGLVLPAVINKEIGIGLRDR